MSPVWCRNPLSSSFYVSPLQRWIQSDLVRAFAAIFAAFASPAFARFAIFNALNSSGVLATGAFAAAGAGAA